MEEGRPWSGCADAATGAPGAVTKPFDLEILSEAVARALDK